MKRLFSIAIMLLFFFGGYIPSYSAQPAEYKINLGDPRWHTKLNAGLDALWDTDADYATVFANWASGLNVVSLVPVTCTYSDADTFTLAGDYSSWFSTGTVVQVQVAAGMAYSTVSSSSYAAPTTTVNLSSAVLTDPITRVYVVATRAGLFPNGPGYVVARDYGTDRAALAAADTVAAAAGKQLVIGAAYSIDDDLTLASNVKIMPGAVLSVATTKTLTINGTLEAGLYQIFSTTGTGKVQFASSFGGKTYPQWHGAAADYDPTGGTGTDDTVAINAAIKALSGSRGSLAFAGNYKITAGMYISNGVSNDGLMIYGEGMARIYQTVTTEAGDGFFVPVSTAVDRITIRDLEIHSSAVNPLSGTYSDWTVGNTEGVNLGDTCTNCLVENVVTTGFGSAGIWLGRDDTCDNNKIINCTSSLTAHGFGIGGKGLHLEIKNCVSFNNPYNGIDVNAVNPVLTGNYCYSNGLATDAADTTARNGIYIGLTGATNDEIIVANNKCISNGNTTVGGTGIKIGGGVGTLNSMVVIGNYLKDCNLGGIAINGATVGTGRVSITGNVVENCATKDINNSFGIYVSRLPNAVITGNTVSGDGTNGRGIVVGVSSDNALVANNYIANFAHGISFVTAINALVVDNKIGPCVTSGIYCQLAGYGTGSIFRGNVITGTVGTPITTGIYLYDTLAVTLGKNYFTYCTTNIRDNASNAYNYNLTREWVRPSFTDNMAQNGLFRDWAGGGATYADNWAATAWTPDSIAQAASPVGGYAMSMTDAANVFYAKQNVACVAGNTYTVSMWLYSADVVAKMVIRKGSDSSTVIAARTVPADSTWHLVQVTFTVPVGETSIDIQYGADTLGTVVGAGVCMVPGAMY